MDCTEPVVQALHSPLYHTCTQRALLQQAAAYALPFVMLCSVYTMQQGISVPRE